MPTAAVRRSALPASTTSFVGREQELAELRRLLGTSRLVTITGEGGCGKTRLALELARSVEGAYPDGLWFVELAPLAEEQFLVQAVAGEVGVHDRSGRKLLDALVAALRPHRALLAIDNCEHLIEGCAALAEVLLRGCPDLRILATSREPLRIDGECAWRLPSLSFPPDAVRGPDDLLSYDAARLFVERAASALPTLHVERHAAAIAEICRRLDGIPLALELAAARVPAIGVEEIAARLESGPFRLLSAGTRTALPRHRTLAALIEWSYDLLTAPEAALLRRLSVFAGGWTLEAAEGVCADEAIAPASVLDLLARLVDKSLVVAEHGEDGPRYRLLETIRQFTVERLAEAGEAGALRERHRCWFLTWGERVLPELVRPEAWRWFDRLEADHENFRVALTHCRETGDADAELRLAAALGRFWMTRGYGPEGVARLDAALAPGGPPSRARAIALLFAGRMRQGLSRAQDLDEADRLTAESAAVACQVGDYHTASVAERHLAVGAVLRGDLAGAETHARAALPHGRAAADRREIAYGLQQLGRVLRLRGELARAEELLTEGLRTARGHTDANPIAETLVDLARVDLARGAPAAAKARLIEAVAVARQARTAAIFAEAASTLGDAAHASGDLPEAVAAYREAIDVAMAGDNGDPATWPIYGLAHVAAAQGQHAETVRLFGFSDRWRGGTPFLGNGRAVEPEGPLAAARAALGEARFAAEWEAGRAMSLEEAVALSRADPAAPAPSPRPDGPLTEREREVAALVARGMTNREIADALVISERTAERHVQNILNKLEFANRSQIAGWAVGRGLAAGT